MGFRLFQHFADAIRQPVDVKEIEKVAILPVADDFLDWRRPRRHDEAADRQRLDQRP